MVSNAQLPHLLDVVKFSAIDDDRLLERALHPLEIRMAVLVPIRDHDQRVRAFERLIVSLSIIYSVAEQTSGVSEGGWIVRADRYSLSEQVVYQRQRRSFAHVICARLEGETPQCHAPTLQLLTERRADLGEENTLLPIVGRLDPSQHVERHSAFGTCLRQRLHVLGKTRPAIS